MKHRIKWIGAIIAVVIFYGILGFLWINDMRDIRAHKFEDWTPRQVKIIKMTWKEKGYYTVKRTLNGVYMDSETGRIWIKNLEEK